MTSLSKWGRKTSMSYQKPITKSRDGIISGVCLGLSERLDIGVGWLRLAWIISVAFLGTGLFLYIIFAISLPQEGQQLERKKMLLGVCLRLSRKMQWDLGLTRSIAAILALGSFGTCLVIYLLLAIFLPDDDPSKNQTIIDL